VEDLWDSIANQHEALELTEAQRVEIERRLAEHESNPETAVPWQDVQARLRQRFP
jgi:putative addiction module component (TIGR02574 family)